MRELALAASVLSLVIASAAPAAGEAPGRPQGKGSTEGQPASDPWAGVRYLVGDWVGEGSGIFSFRFDLENSILVRRDHSEYPAAQGRPAIVHNAVMITYRERGEDRLAAIYFDNEGHVIRYRVSVEGGGKTVVFLSEPAVNAPRFRLTYERVADDTVDIDFGIAPSGEPTAFKTYIAGRSHRAAND